MILKYPIGFDAKSALEAPLGYASHMSEVRNLVAKDQKINFQVAFLGQAWPEKDQVIAAYRAYLAPENLDEAEAGGFWQILPMIPTPDFTAKTSEAPLNWPLTPIFREGHRWPQRVSEEQKPFWQILIRYWRLGEEDSGASQKSARRLRKDPTARQLEARALKALARQPLKPDAPQRALNIGLFEIRPPEAPHIVMPDE